MATIVGIHGIGNQFSGANQLHQNWLPALKDGLSLAGSKIADDDLVCAFYGDLFRPNGMKNAFDPPLDATDVEEGLEADLLNLLWAEAARVDASVAKIGGDTKVAIPMLIQRALNALSNSRFFAGLAERALVFDLKQVKRYFTDGALRKAIVARLANAIQEDTRILIAHSLGSVVAYEALCANPQWPVRTLITLGSPLGIPNLIFEQLQPAPQNGTGVFPQGLEQWINIADNGDVVALVKDLSQCFGQRVQDVRISNGAQAHDATRYLCSRELGDAVTSGL